MDWNDLKYLLALKREGTLAGAARALSVDHSTVSRRLAALEEAIGTQLLRRTPEGLCFTEAGNAAAASAEAMDASASGLLSKLAGEDERDAGVVRLTCAEGIIPFLVTELQELRIAHPELRVELLPSTAPLDLQRREADVAVRMFRPTQAGLVARHVGKLGWSLYANEAYLGRRGLLQSLGDLSGHDVIAYDAELKGGLRAALARRARGERDGRDCAVTACAERCSPSVRASASAPSLAIWRQANRRYAV